VSRWRRDGSVPFAPETLIWALIPFWIDNGQSVNESYDTAQTKLELAMAFRELGIAWVWQPLSVQSVGALVAQMAAFHKDRPAIAFNFCDGVDSQGVPGLSVVKALEAAGIPFTGAGSEFFEISTSKLRMKRMFAAAGVPTAPFEEINGSVAGLCERVGTPLLVKPDISSGSYGISLKSKACSDEELESRRAMLRSGEYDRAFSGIPLFAERFVTGPEFTVFVVGDYRRPAGIQCLTPAERVFDESIPEPERFLSYDRYWGFYKEEPPPPAGKPFYRYARANACIAPGLGELARQAYCAVRGTGYGRVDIRMERSTGELFVLEVNANCGVSDDDQTSCGCILRLDGISFPDLLRMILEESLVRHEA
jgi:D-alanine-D-alanine ligase